MTRIDAGLSPNVQFAGDAGSTAQAAGAGATGALTGGGAAAQPARTGTAAAVSRPALLPGAAGRTAAAAEGLAARPNFLRNWLVIAGSGEVVRPQSGYLPAAARALGSATPASAGTGGTTGTTPKATVTSPLDFLRDSRLSAEEKLVLLLAQQQKDVEKEIETVLKKAEAKSAQKTSGGGLFGKLKVMDVVKSAVPGLGAIDDLLGKGTVQKVVSQLSGPLLAAGATALGMPHLAPLAMSLGPDVLGAALDAEVPVTGGEARAVAGDTKAPANAPNAGTGSSNALDPVETQRLTLLVNRQQQWAGTVSNLLHSLHTTRMGVIQNLR